MEKIQFPIRYPKYLFGLLYAVIISTYYNYNVCNIYVWELSLVNIDHDKIITFIRNAFLMEYFAGYWNFRRFLSTLTSCSPYSLSFHQFLDFAENLVIFQLFRKKKKHNYYLLFMIFLVFIETRTFKNFDFFFLFL